MKTSELTGAALDWAVAKCEGYDVAIDGYGCIINRDRVIDRFEPSTTWGWGGPIIEREKITIQAEWADKGQPGWTALFRKNLFSEDGSDYFSFGPTPLIAAMRCYVASKLGDEVDVPKEYYL